MTRNDRRELPTEHKEGEEQTNENSLDNLVHHLAGPRAVTQFTPGAAVGRSALTSAPIVWRERQQLLQVSLTEKKNHIRP